MSFRFPISAVCFASLAILCGCSEKVTPPPTPPPAQDAGKPGEISPALKARNTEITNEAARQREDDKKK